MASDIIEEAEEEEGEDGDRSDYEEEEDGYASVHAAREFVSVVRPLLASLEERMEAAAPVGTRDGAAGYEGKQDHDEDDEDENDDDDEDEVYDDLEPLPEQRPDGPGPSGRQAKK